MVFKFKIRRARKSDLEAIAKIFREEFARPPFREKWGAKGSLKKIKEYLKGWAVLVAEASGKIVGFVACTTKYWFAKKVGFIDELVVSNKFQKRGVGHALLKKAEIEMGRKGAKMVCLSTNPKSGAFRFYKNLHFQSTGWVLVKKKIRRQQGRL